MAGADVTAVSSITVAEQRAVREIVDEAFVFGFRLVMLGTAGLAFGAAVCGRAIGADVGRGVSGGRTSAR